MNVVKFFRRPSSKVRQSSKLLTSIHNLVSVEEEKTIGDKLRSDNGG